MIYEEREKARRDIASLVDGAERKGRVAVASNLLKMDMEIDKIAAATGLTCDEIKSIQME